MGKNIVTKKAAFALVLAAAVSASVPAVPVQAAVKLNKKSAVLYTKQTVTLRLTGTAKKVKWTSSKTTVASVTQKGKVTAKKAGKTNIKAIVGKKTYTCKVTVKNPSLNTKAASLEAGQTLKLKLTGAVAKSFRSGNTAAVSVTAQGLVTAKGEGMAVITVTDTKNRTYTCTVTVPVGKKDESTDTADNNTNITGSAAGTSEAQAPAEAVHVHDYVPHYSYDGTGKAIMNAYFCTDTTCADNQGYGTDNGWRGEKYTPWYDSRDNAVSAQPSQGTTVVTNPVNNDTSNVPADNNTADSSNNAQTGNTVDTESSTGDAQTGQTEEKPAETEQPAAHAHSWTIPVISGAQFTGYKCAGCGETSHVHMWNQYVKNESGIITAVKCKNCDETISAEDYDVLRNTERSMQAELMNAWIAGNITSGMTDLEKVKKAMAEMNSYTHVSTIPSDEQTYVSCLSRIGSCLGGNGMFADYCKAMGINAEVFSAGQYVGGDHYLTYVYVNGEKLIADATPGGGITGPGTLWTEDALWLYCDLLDGNISDEEYEAQIGQLER